MARIAVVGLGRMGSRMAVRLIDAGHDVVVWNRSPQKTEPLLARGATAATTPKHAAESAEGVITMVADPNALYEVIDGPDGVAAGTGPATTVIQMATVGIDATMRIASMLRPDILLDAPVLGSISEAEAGALVIFVGGPDALIERWRRVLEVLGRPITAGGVGTGSAAKLVANLTLFGTLGVLGESLRLADRLGLSREVAFDVLSATPLSAQAERRRPALESGDFPLRFALALALKDIELIIDGGGDAGDLRLTEAARTWLADAQRAGWGDRDYSSLIAFIIQNAGRIRESG